jgi:HK97 family phage major capsid protein
MANPVLDRLLADRDKQNELADAIMTMAQQDGRDLVKSERDNLEAIGQRLSELDEQIKPISEFEALRNSAASEQARQLGRRDGAPTTTGQASGVTAAYRSAGAFLVDYVRARDPKADPAERAHAADRVAQTRVVEHQTTVDTPGLLPVPVVGEVINLVDASRPFITSIGPKDMGGIPGKRFQRPIVTQQPLVGKQAAEKTELPTRKMIIGSLEWTKETYGGVVNISRQDIDWTSPSAWDILVQALADQYAIATENAAGDAFAASVIQTWAAESADLTGYAQALYAAAAQAYQGSSKLPDRIWVSLDMWALLGPITDVLGRLTFNGGSDGAGSSSVSDFRGDMLGLDRVVVPSFPVGTMIVGNHTLYEFYEDRIGLLSAVEPAILGVEVAYGGYVAHGSVEPKGFAKVTSPPAP